MVAGEFRFSNVGELPESSYKLPFQEFLCRYVYIIACDPAQDAGEDIPVGLFMSNWAASFLLTEIVAVLVEEVLGYHVQIEPTLGSHGASTLYALAGCLNPNGPIEEKQCGKNETRAHAAVEVWIGTYASDLTYMEENYPSINPEDLGSMGFRGEESMFLTRQVLEAGLDAEGLALNFYRSYNTSHHNPKQYFGSVSDVDVSILRPCRSGTHFTVAQYMNDYLTWTGDLGGLVAVNGSWQARCVGADGHPAPGGGFHGCLRCSQCSSEVDGGGPLHPAGTTSQSAFLCSRCAMAG